MVISPSFCPLNFLFFKKNNKQKDKKIAKAKQKYKTWSLFCVGQLFLSRGPAWSVVDFPSVILLEKIDFPFSSRHLLQTASCLEVELCVHCPFSFLNMCMSCACFQDFCEFMSVSPIVSGRHYFLEVIYHLWLLESVHFLLYVDL